jgi:hypothetical protein
MKDFIPYEEALELKQLGFDEPCFGFWSSENTYRRSINDSICNSDLVNMFGDEAKQTPSAPTWQQAFRWFKQNHKLKFHIREDIWNAWCYVHILMRDEYESVGDYSTYEEAELECLRKLIEIVKQKQ